MDSNQNYNSSNMQNPQSPYRSCSFPNPGNTMAIVSLILGIGCVGTIFTVYLPFVLGSLAIIFAILSKGYGKKMLGTAKAGIGISIAGIILVSAMISALVGVILSSSRDTLIRFGQQVDQQLESQTGLDPEDILGTSYEEIMREYADLLNK